MAVHLRPSDQKMSHQELHRFCTRQLPGIGGICLGDRTQAVCVQLVVLFHGVPHVKSPPLAEKWETADYRRTRRSVESQHSSVIRSLDLTD